VRQWDATISPHQPGGGGGAGSGGVGGASALQLSPARPRIASWQSLLCSRTRCPCHATARKGGPGVIHCPNHDDDHPSLGVLRGGLVGRCFAGCPRREVLRRLREVGALDGVASVAIVSGGITKSFSDNERGRENSPFISPPGDTWQHGDTVTLSTLAQAKGLDEALLRSLGWGEWGGRVSIPYLDEAGQVLCVRYRVSLGGPLKTISRKGDRVAFLGLPWLREAARQGYIIVCEGETDFVSLFQAGVPALAVPGANSFGACLERSPHVLELLRGIKVYVTREPDQGGEALVAQVARHLPHALVVEMPCDPKDWNGLWLQAGRDKGRFLAEVERLLAQARAVSQLAEEEGRREADAPPEEVREFLLRPDIVSELTRLTEGLGHQGDHENVAALHLALATVRLGPVSVLIKGGASSGKSDLLATALKLWPQEVYVFRSGASERWLAYTDEDFRHRFIVLAEARALESDFGAYLARTLVSEGRLIYETVEKTAQGLRARRIEKEGPTGLIATTTASLLDEELETRCWTIESREDESYLVEAARAIAQRHSAPRGEPEGVETARKALLWLYRYGSDQVVVPFGVWLAERVPLSRPPHLRLFDRLLRCIEASAWLHQLQRERDGEGRIVSTIADYAIARRVMERAFKAGARELTDKQAEVLEALSRLSAETQGGWVPLRQVARELGKSPGTVRKHLQALVRRGYVATMGKGGPFKPEAEPPVASPLPTPEELAEAFPHLRGVAMSPGVAREGDKGAIFEGRGGEAKNIFGIPFENGGDDGDTGDAQMRVGVASVGDGGDASPSTHDPWAACEEDTPAQDPPLPPNVRHICPRCGGEAEILKDMAQCLACFRIFAPPRIPGWALGVFWEGADNG
jgi:DNA-binding transcriptional ArsR family regulator